MDKFHWFYILKVFWFVPKIIMLLSLHKYPNGKGQFFYFSLNVSHAL